MPQPKQLKVPASVLAQAKAAVPAPNKRPTPAPKGKHAVAREKVVAALKKLHPMD